MNLRLLSLTSAAALLAATMAFGQNSPFPSVSGQQPATSPFPSVSGQQQRSSPFPSVSGQQQPSTFPSVSGGTQAVAPPGGSAFPSVSGGPASAPATPMLAPGMGMGMPGFGGPQAGQEPPCMADFVKLRSETERRGKAVKAASDRQVPPGDACKLLTNFVEADRRMLRFVEANSASCGIPPEIGKSMRTNHASAEQVRKNVCAAAQAQQRGPQGPSFSDVLGAPSLPDASATNRAGGSTFDTLNGNVLAR